MLHLGMDPQLYHTHSNRGKPLPVRWLQTLLYLSELEAYAPSSIARKRPDVRQG
jgi:hypothetical protein